MGQKWKRLNNGVQGSEKGRKKTAEAEKTFML